MDVINSTGGGFNIHFPEVQPDYLSNASDVNGWSVVTDRVKIASRDIFSSLSSFLNISFNETSNPDNVSVIAIMG